MVNEREFHVPIGTIVRTFPAQRRAVKAGVILVRIELVLLAAKQQRHEGACVTGVCPN